LPETQAIPLAIEAALGKRSHFLLVGSDYRTRDGSCIRDFVHVLDLADAHTRAVEHLLSRGDSVALNLGTGHGTTIKESLSAIQRMSGRNFALNMASVGTVTHLLLSQTIPWPNRQLVASL
jgi:UDP-glucose 4-epimerase